MKVSANRHYLIDDHGQPFFYLADTVWRAFTKIEIDEWEEYLTYRRKQGFNVLQINVLDWPNHTKFDFSVEPPFYANAAGTYDYGRINDAYFDRAATMLDMAVNKGFVSALVLLWGNYVADTWNSKETPDYVMPIEAITPYVEYVVNKFAPFQPIWLVSGDTNFPTELTNQYYMTALKALKALNPDALAALHIWADTPDVPDDFAQSDWLDFYMYQSGHRYHQQDLPYLHAQRLHNDYPKRPIVNGEPCYEGHKDSRNTTYHRFTAFDIRKATWQSLLSGASVGVAYGAHGTWMWYRKGEEFAPKSSAGMPYEWQVALRFPGAWDVGLAKWIFETYNLFGLEPQDIVVNDTPEIRAAGLEDRLVIYLPYNMDVELTVDAGRYTWTMFDLAHKRVVTPEIFRNGDRSILYRHDFCADVLYIGCR